MHIAVTSDDLQVKTLPLFYKYWEPLKEKHPNLKVTFFCAPDNQEFSQGAGNNVYESTEFRKWFEENKSWVEIQPHGYNHTKPPENLCSEEEQERGIREGLFCLRDYVDDTCLVYKAPFYQMNTDTLKILLKLGFVGYSQWWNLNLLVPQKRHLPYFVEVGSHTNLEVANNPDNIDKVYDDLDYNLTAFEEKGFTYATMGEIVKGVT